MSYLPLALQSLSSTLLLGHTSELVPRHTWVTGLCLPLTRGGGWSSEPPDPLLMCHVTTASVGKIPSDFWEKMITYTLVWLNWLSHPACWPPVRSSTVHVSECTKREYLFNLVAVNGEKLIDVSLKRNKIQIQCSDSGFTLSVKVCDVWCISGTQTPSPHAKERGELFVCYFSSSPESHCWQTLPKPCRFNPPTWEKFSSTPHYSKKYLLPGLKALVCSLQHRKH